jgi:multidrug efflux pump subunit AcrB
MSERDDDDVGVFAEETRETPGRPMDSTASGPIAWMARNSVAANLLMFIILVGGALGMTRIKQEVFPEFSLDFVVVSVPYPGASPAEVEQGIVLAIEEAVRGLDGVKRVTSKSAEGSGSVNVELLLDADPDKALSDVKAAVDRIRSFPEDAERANVTLASRKREVITIVIAGDQDLGTLHALAERARAQLLESPEVTQVEVLGVPPTEISIELSRARLEQYGLSPDDVARQVQAASIELPGGEIETRGGELLVRLSDRRREGHEFADVIVKSTAGGAIVRLGDVATIRDGYQDTDQSTSYGGRNTVRVTAYRVGDETPSSVATATREFVERFQAEVPPQLEVKVWADDSEILQDRINLLTNNAMMGLVLVLIILGLFLEIRVAGWVALGIPISFLGAFLVMPVVGLSVNMVSLFGFIITLGMVVDDAIIVGEHSFARMQTGEKPIDAAIHGARDMSVPVTFAVLTSMAAFAPMLFVPGVMGKIFALFPLVVGSVLLFSLIESFFILPAHLAHLKSKPPRWLRPLEVVHEYFGMLLQRFIRGAYLPALKLALRWRYASVATAFASLLIAIGLIAGQIVPFSFFPELESDQVTASARLPYGAPERSALQAQALLEKSAERTMQEMGDSFFKGMLTKVGEGALPGGPGRGGAETGGHLVTLEVRMVGSGDRPFNAAVFAENWRKNTPPIAGLESLVFNSSAGPGAGAAVEVQLAHEDSAVLAVASEEVAQALRSFNELTSVSNEYSAGKPQLDFKLKPEARTLGLTSVDIARQLRSSFFGAEALREQRGRDEMKVMIRLAEDERRSEGDLEDLRIRTPAGALVPLGQVAEFDRGRAPTSINREDGRRTINVSAKLALGVVSPQPVLSELREKILPELRSKHPRLEAGLVGQQRSQQETFAALGQNFLLALFVIFALLAVPFKSYLQPLIVMSAIPFGFVGAVIGHLIMGFELSLISMFGIIALAGVVVNDSLVLIDATNRKRAEGQSAMEAIIFGGTRRFRPILLTSLTTFFGLLPMIFETSIQARFLIPMAISLGFGVLFASVIALLVVPSLYMILEDARELFGFEDPRGQQGEHG